MSSSNFRDIISARRESVIQAYNSARAENHLRFLEDDYKATAEYIFPNQMEDANNIVDLFYKNKRRVISIQKKTKVGADGLMIELAKVLTTHIDDNFVVNPANVRIITGMSNASWEKDMIDKAPNCFKDKIFHHGKLSKADLMNISNGLFIIDEIDTGDKEYQRLHTTLKEAGVLDVKHMEEHNNMFVFISATMIKELYNLYPWGELHEVYNMTIPHSYFGHKDFLARGIVKEFYPLMSNESAEKWIQEDILDNYGTDYRVHIVRLNAKGKNKNVDIVHNAAIRKHVVFRNHTSNDRLSADEINELFKEPLKQHIILGVIGFFRRANLIPNRWKLRIGATHELHTKIVDNNVQIQGLTGRMTGYWRDDIEAGHKTGPHRTSIKAIEEYEKIYLDPFGLNTYQTAGFKKKRGNVSSDPIMLSAKHISNLEPVDLPIVIDTSDPKTVAWSVPKVFTLTDEEYSSIKKDHSHSWLSSVLCVLEKRDKDVVADIQRMRLASPEDAQDNCTEAIAPTIYEDAITKSVNAALSNTKYWREGNKRRFKYIDKFGIYLHPVEKRIIVMRYYGTKINVNQ
jgi:hypothetical protein